jgi:hypothetical protein
MWVGEGKMGLKIMMNLDVQESGLFNKEKQDVITDYNEFGCSREWIVQKRKTRWD